MGFASQFNNLFKGLTRAYGTYKVETTKAEGAKLTGPRSTIVGEVTDELWEGHLNGSRRIGIVPITDDSTCRFGAIDIDIYDGLDYSKVARGVKEHKLPLVPSKSKSGGIHLWCFLSEPMGAAALQAKLQEFSGYLGFAGVEIFPKQVQVLADRGDIGNWINMPYFGGENTTTYAFDVEGGPLKIEEFLEYAKVLTVTPAQLLKISVEGAGDLSDGPPCLQHLAQVGCPPGTRNDGLFNFAVYARKVSPQDWEQALFKFNNKFMRPPLTDEEVRGVIKSASRKEYIYTCSKPPIKPYCNSGLCRSRKHGVGPMVGMPTFSNLTKFDSRPPIWFLDIDGGGRLELATEDMQQQSRFQKRCMEALNMMPMSTKPNVWHSMMQALLEKVNIIEAPPDASPQGQLLEYLETFCTSRAQARSRDELILGKPWVEHGRVYFKLSSFVEFLEKKHFKTYTATQVSSIIKEHFGGEHKFFKIKDKGCNTWSVPVFDSQKVQLDVPPLEDKEHF